MAPSIKQIASAAALGAALLMGIDLFTSPAQATPYVVTLTEQGGNVVANGSGAIDLTGLTSLSSPVEVANSINADIAQISNGAGVFFAAIQAYTGFTGPTSFGSGVNTFSASSGSGDEVGIAGAGDSAAFLPSFLVVPSGYASDTALSDTATYTGQTLASLGVTPGTYTWTWGTGADQNFTLIIGTPTSVPEPSALTLFGTALAGFFLITRRRNPCGHRAYAALANSGVRA